MNSSTNFFSIGGDSIKAIQLSSHLSEKGYNLSLCIPYLRICQHICVQSEQNIRVNLSGELWTSFQMCVGL
ncbi:MAG: acyl carrier protein [Clostridiales bacterium]|nr:acyl carrier protein [Clostridiales bacterium]